MLTETDVQLIASLCSISGFTGSVSQWLVQATSRSSKKKADQQKETIEDYLEWLRRKDHKEVIKGQSEILETLKKNKNQRIALAALITGFQEQSQQQHKTFLQGLARLDDRLSTLVREIVDRDVRKQSLTSKRIPSREFQDFEAKFRERVANRYAKLRLLGIREMRDVRQELSIAYVCLRLASDSSNDNSSSRAEAALATLDSMTIQGAAGSGKTTLLSWIALQCSQEDAEPPWQNCVPFFVPLRRLGSVGTGRPNLSHLVDYTIPTDTLPSDPPDQWIEQVLEDGRAVLLLDGVDELPSECRSEFWEWVSDIDENLPGNRIYVTSRPPRTLKRSVIPEWNPPASFDSAAIEEMDEIELRVFIDNWHSSVLQLVTDEKDELDLEYARIALDLPMKCGRSFKSVCFTQRSVSHGKS